MNSDNAIFHELSRINTLCRVMQASTDRAMTMLLARMSNADLENIDERKGFGPDPATTAAPVADLNGNTEPPRALEEKAAAPRPATKAEPEPAANPFGEEAEGGFDLDSKITDWEGLAARTGTNLRKFYGKDVNIGTVCANWTDDRSRIEGIGKASRSDLEDLIDQTTAQFGDEAVATYAIAPPGSDDEGDDGDELPQIIQDAMEAAGEDKTPTTVAAFRTIMMKATSLTPDWSEATTPAFEELGINGPAAIEDTPETVGRAFRVLSRHFGALEYES